ncbi:MAG TPA: hypothetical protein VEI97_08245 [bacterium]|nr:hypothetical protein [bacterium]
MDLFPDPDPPRVADRPPDPPRPKGHLLRCEHREANQALMAALGAGPEELARVLSVAVWRLEGPALRRVAELVLRELAV